MKLIKQKFEILEQQLGIDGIYKMIELAGRTCYKSEDKITEDSAKGFVDRMIKSGHHSVLEHGTVYLSIPYNEAFSLLPDTNWAIDSYEKDPYSIIRLHGPYFYVTTNYRVLVEHNWLGDLMYLCEPTEFHERRVSVRFILPIGISREFCRHRVFSFAEQSTRYCNFSSNKFNNELTFIEDLWCDEELLRQIEYWYINSYLKAQEKRNMLPLCTKTELIMTGFVSDWKHFFTLRSNKYGKGGAHPSADELATPLYEEFVARGYINDLN